MYTKYMMDSETFYYFAYGMNTCPHIMDRHKVCIAVGPALLENYHLVFRYHVSIDLGGKVHGVLWEINDDTLASLDIQEGYPRHYNRMSVKIKCNGEVFTAITYIMNGDNLHTSFALLGPLPSEEYLRHMYNGYKAFRLPLEQLHDALTEIPEERQ